MCATHSDQFGSHSAEILKHVQSVTGKPSFHFDFDKPNYYQRNALNLCGAYLEWVFLPATPPAWRHSAGVYCVSLGQALAFQLTLTICGLSERSLRLRLPQV